MEKIYNAFRNIYPNLQTANISTREETSVDEQEQKTLSLDTEPVSIHNTQGTPIMLWAGVGILFIILMAYTGKSEV
jgi:hypothetical protein